MGLFDFFQENKSCGATLHALILCQYESWSSHLKQVRLPSFPHRYGCRMCGCHSHCSHRDSCHGHSCHGYECRGYGCHGHAVTGLAAAGTNAAGTLLYWVCIVERRRLHLASLATCLSSPLVVIYVVHTYVYVLYTLYNKYIY